MMFTNGWSDTSPSDTELANTLGADIRRLRLDIEERMNTLVTDWKADPLVLNPTGGLGAQTGLKRVISFASFNSNQNAHSNNMHDGYQAIDAPGVVLYASLDWLPVGSVITLVEYLIDQGTATHINCQLARQAFNATPGAMITLDTIDITIAGVHINPSAALTHTVSADYQYFLRIQSTAVGNGSLFAARVTYNLPSLAQR